MAIFTTERRHKKFSVPVIALGRWSSSDGGVFTRWRVYFRRKWTPFCLIEKRY